MEQDRLLMQVMENEKRKVSYGGQNNASPKMGVCEYQDPFLDGLEECVECAHLAGGS